MWRAESLRALGKRLRHLELDSGLQAGGRQRINYLAVCAARPAKPRGARGFYQAAAISPRDLAETRLTAARRWFLSAAAGGFSTATAELEPGFATRQFRQE
ncbi:MAG TPA: hypothetical protein VGC77_13465 [Rhodopseudomonas sp.]|uniref:hypothetical protein n=1 Tax=Rhodopseudomonas sp. TaxID=1078 RepID=UPI002ED8FBD6